MGGVADWKYESSRSFVDSDAYHFKTKNHSIRDPEIRDEETLPKMF